MPGPGNAINEVTTGICGFTGTAFVGTPVTNHAVIIGGSTSSALTNVGPTATAGQVLQSAGASADPVFSTATFPATATGTGTILRADGTNWVATTATYPNTSTANQLLYSSAANTIGGLSTANNGTLVTSNAGVPSILAGPGTTGNILQSNAAAAPSFSTATYPSTTTINQILFSSSNNVVGGITAANSASLVSSSTGVPSWAAMTSGQLIIGNTGGTPTAAVPTSTGGNFITGAGTLKYIPANYQPGFSNIGFTYSAGTFTVAGFDGTALSATNPGYVTIQNPSSPGNLITIAITANQTFTDGSGGTIAGMKFGLPYGGTDVSWANNMPLFLYAVVKSDGTAIAFMVSRNPAAVQSPAAAGIGQSGSTVNVGQTDMFSLLAITASNYATQPCIYIGCFQAQYTAGTPSFYTVQALTSGIDGPGLNYNTKSFLMPSGANGAASGKYFQNNTGTAPSWTAQQYSYYVRNDGTIRCQFSGATSLAVAGVGAVNACFILPYNITVLNNPMTSGLSVIGSVSGAYVLLTGIADAGPQIFINMALQTGNVKTLNTFFIATNTNICSSNISYLTQT